MGQQRVIQGTVVSDKMDKTIVVSVRRHRTHRLYHKVIRRTKRYPVHDPQNLADPSGPTWLEEVVRDATGLGGVYVFGLVAPAVAGYMGIDRKPHAAPFLVIAVYSGLLLSIQLESFFDRPRPDIMPHLM